MTLGAMAIAIGLVIDDAVVITGTSRATCGSRMTACRPFAPRCKS